MGGETNVIPAKLLFLIELTIVLVDSGAEVTGVAAECDVEVLT